jgi:hypothetical protein
MALATPLRRRLGTEQVPSRSSAGCAAAGSTTSIVKRGASAFIADQYNRPGQPQQAERSIPREAYEAAQNTRKPTVVPLAGVGEAEFLAITPHIRQIPRSK